MKASSDQIQYAILSRIEEIDERLVNVKSKCRDYGLITDLTDSQKYLEQIKKLASKHLDLIQESFDKEHPLQNSFFKGMP